MKFISYIAMILLLASSLIAEEKTLNLPIYNIEIDEKYLKELDKNPFSDEFFPAKFKIGDLQYECIARYRGGTSRNLPKKSWRIKVYDICNSSFMFERVVGGPNASIC